MNLAEIRKKANRERDETKPQPSPPETLDLPEKPDWVDFASSVEVEEPYMDKEAEVELEKPDIPSEPRVIAAPAFPAAGAVEFSAASATSPVGETMPRAEFTEPAPEARVEDHIQLYDPVEILLAGRAAAGFGQDTPLTSPETAEIEINDYQEFLCFRVGTERYAINIMEIKEIIKPREVTEVPRVPEFISGVLSLRGIIIPVFNMGRRLHLAPVEHSVSERIIVVSRGEELFGIQVDEVLQVVRINEDAIEQPPAVLDGIDRDFVQGIGRHGGRMLILLNLASILDVSLC